MSIRFFHKQRLPLKALGLAALLIVTACSVGPNFVAEYEPWRDAEERQCLASGLVQQTEFLQSRAALGGPSVCGAIRPFVMSGAAEGRVVFHPAALVRCPMVPQIERWVVEIVEPAARATFGVPVAEITIAASYSCRPMNHQFGGRLSEHGHANALDVSAFVLADGRKITVKSGWRGDRKDQAFLRAIHGGGCDHFTTVLGPEHDAAHRDHFHLDLRKHGRDGLGRICK